MRVVKSVSVEDLECRGSIKDSDVTRLVRGLADDPVIHENEAEALLRLNRTCPVQGPSWSGFLVDAISDYILNQAGPEGYITIEKSQWLTAKLSSDGWIANRTELDLLVAILGKARWFPLSLATFALEQVAGAVIHGFGPLRVGQAAAVPGTIGATEVGLIRVILGAFGGDSAIPITRDEAEILIGINKAVAGRTTPAWTDLFAKALANVVLSESGYAVPPRMVALRPATTLAVEESLEQQVAQCLGLLRPDYHRPSNEERALARLERQRIEIVTGEIFADEEEAWLTGRLLAGRRRSVIEAAVIAHLDREGLIGPPSSEITGLRDGKAA
jgi:hypothetical protein